MFCKTDLKTSNKFLKNCLFQYVKTFNEVILRPKELPDKKIYNFLTLVILKRSVFFKGIFEEDNSKFL